ncbi:response regulator transcription factor [Ectobacillus antri]|jgi:DNA-binding NarL/FixJ family response regulator|uniref:Response regulator transcription factor n=1 Tax=Ectobacillus antri TaxID=2486280 RepID=A0ABT6H869_9BACI|nr:response regulator transcription factor [Ectobacillus antri]MDG4658046.1 response regulator transcription factor [Ectobacillus antri]MDG5755063.1 response regulator transcription factor [Ectobacillus antri]
MIKIMLVDDQELIRESLAFVLNTDPELEVVALAKNGQEAVELSKEKKPNIILMDIQMPIMDGITATKFIKATHPEIRIMILTTFQEIQHVIDALSIGAEGYLLKAMHPKDLIAGIKLVHTGGTLLPNDLAKILVQQIQPSVTQAVQAPTPYDLTEREVQVLECLAHGLSNKDTAERLFLSEGTVKNYISSLYHKLDVKNRLQAVNKAKEEDLI